MQMKRIQKSLSCILCMVLIVAMTLFTTGCNGNTGNVSSSVESTEAAFVDVTVLGEGSLQFAFCVVDKEGNETHFEIHTDKPVVGEALLDVGLIEGEESQYGLYVKVVNGITADYNTDGTYWAFYVNDEYAQSGVDTTSITEGTSYSFKVQK